MKNKASLVYYLPANDLNRIEALALSIGLAKTFKPDDCVAIKLHFGEPGNQAHLKPRFVKPVVTALAKITPDYFLTDTNTLYKGERSEAVVHLKTAQKQGYDFAPVLIADGLWGLEDREVVINQKHFEKVKIGSAIYQASALLVLSHFKGHDMTGFGGAIKNLGMGCGSRPGKQQMHADFKPKIKTHACKKDGACSQWCPTHAISHTPGKIPSINLEICIGCGACLAACRFGAIDAVWGESTEVLQEKMAEYALGVAQSHREKIVYFNYLLEISPNCDCYSHCDPPVVPDLGVLASLDPVALDQASIDLVNQAARQDIFRKIYPYVDWNVQLSYAEAIGLGRRDYTLQNV